MSVQMKRVAVAMSGGVDSSVAALLLKQQGYDVVGLSMRLYSYEKEATHGCCTPEDLYDARRVADLIQIPHYVTDFEAVFEEKVISNFIQSYRFGETPNPCARCNMDVKFSALLKKAEELGANYLATGHYARKGTIDGKTVLLRGIDRARDQSYFLFGLSQSELEKLMFPLGDLTKVQVRKIAKEAGLNVAEKPDSQEICFVPKNYESFVEKKLDPKDKVKGKIFNEKGEALGNHDGIHNFTIGQRKRIGVSSQLPMYVVSIQKSGDVIVGSDEALFKRKFDVREVSWVSNPPEKDEEVLVQIRSRFEASPAIVCEKSERKFSVSFEKPQRAITPGQAAVFYKNDQVLGGGWIDSVA